MSMNLLVADLEMIVAAVRKVEASGLDVTQMKVGNHMVWLSSTDDQRDGRRAYMIRGISDKPMRHEEHPTFRSDKSGTLS